MGIVTEPPIWEWPIDRYNNWVMVIEEVTKFEEAKRAAENASRNKS